MTVVRQVPVELTQVAPSLLGRLKLLHDLQEGIVDIFLVGKAVLNLSQIAQCVVGGQLGAAYVGRLRWGLRRPRRSAAVTVAQTVLSMKYHIAMDRKRKTSTRVANR
jgi:hypothetical protein